MHTYHYKESDCLISVRGGIEHGMGIFVADVNEDSMADAVGLQV